MLQKILILAFGLSFSLSTQSQSLSYNHMDELLSDPTLADTVRVNMLDKIAIDYSSRNAYLAEKYAIEALDLSKKAEYKSGICRSLRIIGLSCLSQVRYPEALSNFLEGLKIAEKEDNLVEKAAILNCLGEFYMTLKDYDRSRQYYNQAILIYRKIGDDRNALEVYGNISQAFQGMGELDKAETLTMDVLRTAITQKNLAATANSYKNLGDIFVKREELDKALFWYQKALPIYLSEKDDKNRVLTISKLGTVYYKKGEPLKAKTYFLQTVQLSINSGSPKIEIYAYRHLASIDSLTGNMSSALSNFQRFAFMKDSLDAVDKQLKVEKIKSRSDLETKQKSIDTLVKVSEKQEISLKNQSIVIVAFFVLILLIVIMCLVLNFFYRQKRIANKTLESQKQELVALNHVKDRLFSVISHDLRSPLANLEAILGLMETGDLSTEEVIMLASQLTHNVQDTSNMLDNLLQWSKSQMQGQNPKKMKADLRVLVGEVINFFKQQAEKKAISIKLTSTENSITNTDSEMIKLVIRNLLGNAIKFTPTGGLIHIEIKSSIETILVSVKDSGLGISDANKANLFRGETISTTGTQDEKGTGLGLMLCKDFVEKNGGTIWVESELGKGSLFSFSLPLVSEPVKSRLDNKAKVF